MARNCLRVRALGALLTLSITAVSGSALSIKGFEPERHNLFYSGPDREFLGDDASYGRQGLDFTGVGRAVGGLQNVVMISDSYFLTAEHVSASYAHTPNTLRFFRDEAAPDAGCPAGDCWQAKVTPASEFGVRVDGADLWLGKLEEPAPDWVERYPLARLPEHQDWSTFYDEPGVVVGWSPTYGAQTTGEIKNVAVGLSNLDPTSKESDEPWLRLSSSSSGVGADKVSTISGDSGSPTFLSTPAGLAVVGVHTKQNKDTDVSRWVDEIKRLVSEPVSVVSPLAGDVNGNLRVGIEDFSALAGSWGKLEGSSYQAGDLTLDGRVDNDDLTVLLSGFGKVFTSPADINKDFVVDAEDLKTIGRNLFTKVDPSTSGDANGDGRVDLDDLVAFDNARLDAPSDSDLVPFLLGDLNRDGQVNRRFDQPLLLKNLNVLDRGADYYDGDLDGDRDVDWFDLQAFGRLVGTIVPMDLNGDSVVDLADARILTGDDRWGKKTGGGAGAGDFNLDGRIDSKDFDLFADWWKFGYYEADWDDPRSVPTPATATLAALAILVTQGRRRRG